MATIEVCDNCGAQSPDANGLHVANHWVECSPRPVRLPSSYVGPARSYVLCCDCWRRATAQSKTIPKGTE